MFHKKKCSFYSKMWKGNIYFWINFEVLTDDRRSKAFVNVFYLDNQIMYIVVGVVYIIYGVLCTEKKNAL